MKCFSIHEQADVGLYVFNQPAEGELVGPVIIIGADGACTKIELSKEQRDVYERALLAQMTPNRLSRAELSQSPPFRLVKEHLDRRSDQCLAHVSTACGVGGHLWYEANSFVEEVQEVRGRSRVVRTYNPFPAPGIEVLATGCGENGEPHSLLLMVPGASFRICRTGDLHGLSPVLIVAWTGSVLRVFPPKKYAQAQEAEEQVA